MKSVAATLAGLVTCALTIAGAVALERWTGYAVHSFTVWFVFPLGALITGALAASGFRLGAKRLGYHPPASYRWLVVLLVGATLPAIAAVDYCTIRIGALPLRDVLSFGDYLKTVILHGQHTLLTSHGQTAAGLSFGAWGYVSAGVQLLGFIAAPLLFGELPEPPPATLDVELTAIIGRGEILSSWQKRRPTAQLRQLENGLALLPLTPELRAEMSVAGDDPLQVVEATMAAMNGQVPPQLAREMAALSFAHLMVYVEAHVGQPPRALVWRDGKLSSIDDPTKLLAKMGVHLDRHRSNQAWITDGRAVTAPADAALEAKLWALIDKAHPRAE